MDAVDASSSIGGAGVSTTLEKGGCQWRPTCKAQMMPTRVAAIAKERKHQKGYAKG